MTNQDIAGDYDWCIAGGWAACPQLAQDQDVWIFGDPFEVRDRVQRRMARVPGWVPADPQDQEPEDYVLRAEVRIAKIGKLDNREFMATDAADALGLIEAFDISTHQCAITSDLEFVKGSGWTPITAPPKVLFDTANTQARMEKITARYGGGMVSFVDLLAEGL